MYQEASDLERRLSDLQSQIDRLTLSLNLWRESQDRLQPVERRLSQLTDQAAEILDRSIMTGERAQQDTAARMAQLQRIIEHEWTAIRDIHETPVRQLREQATTLTEMCVATATSALSGFDRAEARLAGLETTFQRHLADLSEQVRSAVGELRAVTASQSQGLAKTAPSWPLEGVVRLHNQLRDNEDAPASPPPEAPRALLPESTTELADRMATLEQTMSESQTQMREAAERQSRNNLFRWIAFAVIVAALAGGAALVVRLQRQVGVATARVTEAERQAQAATVAADRQIVAVREDAAQQIADARTTALRAQLISDVLAAPDLVRYALIGADNATRLTAQVLWSRSRGLILSGTRLPAPPPNSAYQIWLLTAGAPVSAGVFVPDPTGRFTFVTETLRVPRTVMGVSVTMEPAGGQDAPTGAIVLARPPTP